MEGWFPSAYLEKYPQHNSTNSANTGGPELRLMRKSSVSKDNNSIIPDTKPDSQIDGFCSSIERKVTEGLENIGSSVELR